MNDVTIGVGGEQLVTSAPTTISLERITTDVRGGVLMIDQTGNVDVVTPMSVEITVPSLGEVRLSGSGAIFVDGHQLDGLTITLPRDGSHSGGGDGGDARHRFGGTGEADSSGSSHRTPPLCCPVRDPSPCT